MKNIYLIFISFFMLGGSLQAFCQQSNFSLDTNQLLRENTKSVIYSVLSDSQNSNIKFVVNRYTGLIHVYDSIRYKSKHRRCSNNNSYDSVVVAIPNPFSEKDYTFVIKQFRDTTSVIFQDSSLHKIFIKSNQLVSGKTIIFEKPIFSVDLKHSFILTTYYWSGGSAGYESYYILENGKWVKSRTRCVWRE